MTLHTEHGSATSTGRRTRTLRGLVAAAVATSLLGLAACGDDSTVDNSQSEVVVPSVSESAEPSASATDEEGANASNENTPAPNNPAPAPQDSGAEQVETIPGATSRSAEDDEYLNKLREGGIDLGEVEGANAPGGIEDQLIAAARGYCQTEAAGNPDVFTALAAGQLKTQGVVDREPQDIQPIIVDAARSAYCG